MTTMTSVRLDAAAQALVDSRLDTIERMLLGRVARQDRLEIVREVEAQIFDLLAERGTDDEPDRDDVLAVLARLDPPEAYLDHDRDDDEPATPSRPRPRTVGPRAVDTRAVREAKVARASGILGLAAIGMILLSPLVYLLGALTDSELILIGGLFMTLGLVLLGGFLAIALGIYARLHGPWSIVGVVAGAFSTLFGLAGSFWLLLELA